MAYMIHCPTCNQDSWVSNIVDLIDNHTDDTFGCEGGKLICGYCGKEGYIHQKSKLLEPGQYYERFIRAVIRIDTGIPTYSPYIFINSDSEDEGINHIHFNYYKDLRSEGKNLKHGHGPGGAPVFDAMELLQLIEGLIKIGILNKRDLKKMIGQEF